jgi:hypothetical protein
MRLGIVVTCSIFACKEPAPLQATAPAAEKAAPAQALPPPAPSPAPSPLPALAADPGDSSGSPLWSIGLGGDSTDAVRGISQAPGGAIYLAGYIEGESHFASAGAHRSRGDSDGFVAAISAAGETTWVKTLGEQRSDTANAVAATDTGVVVVGSFADNLVAGPLRASSAGSDDLFVLGLAPDGTERWLFTAGGPDSDAATAAAATPDGGWVVAGSFTARADFASYPLQSRGATDAVLLKLSAAGQVQWVKSFGGEYTDDIYRVAVDSQGSIYAAGRSHGPASFGGEILKGVSAGDSDIVLAKYDAGGAHLWSRRFGNAFNEMIGGLAVDPAGHVAIAGSFDDELMFFGNKLVASGESDILVARFTTTGDLLWVRTWGGAREDVGFAISSDPAGNLVATGWFQHTADFSGAALTSKGNRDVFVIKLSPDGKPLWRSAFGDKNNDMGWGVVTSSDGSSTVTGVFRFDLGVAGSQVVSRFRPGDRTPPPDIFVTHLRR